MLAPPDALLPPIHVHSFCTGACATAAAEEAVNRSKHAQEYPHNTRSALVRTCNNLNDNQAQSARIAQPGTFGPIFIPTAFHFPQEKYVRSGTISCIPIFSL